MPASRDQLDEIRWATTALAEKQASYRLHRNYYGGTQRLMISEERIEKVFRGLFTDFRLNLCASVVDALADRLQVSSFSSGDEDAEDALEIWKRNRMRRRAGHVHQEAIASGDCFVVVWPDAQDRATIYPNSPTQMTVEYDPESPGKITRAAKLWRAQDKTHHLTLYYPDRIEKYATENREYSTADSAAQAISAQAEARAQSQVSSLGVQNFTPRKVAGEPWPLRNPYGRVPVFHFANAGDLGESGISELRDAIPVQDGLNKTILDMLVNGEFQAYPQRYALNIEIRKDDEGNPINPFVAGPERVWALTGGENMAVGQFAQGDIEALDRVAQTFSLRIAQVTQTPPHYFMLSSNFVSGESQKTAEQKLDAKTLDRQIAFGDSWADLMAFAVRIEKGLSADGLELDTNWKDTKPRNELESWQIAGLKAERGVPDEQILKEMGYEQDQIDEFDALKQASPPVAVDRTRQVIEEAINGQAENGATPATREGA